MWMPIKSAQKAILHCSVCGVDLGPGHKSRRYCPVCHPLNRPRRSHAQALRSHAADLVRLHLAGETLEAIGQKYGVTRERIRQIIKQHGFDSATGGKAVNSQQVKIAKLVRRDSHFREKYGCSYNDFKRIKKEAAPTGHTPPFEFGRQKANAARRGIEWSMSFAEWWQVWADSGKWASKGRGIGKSCMCRYKDEGAYAPGNVYIGDFAQNSRNGKRKIPGTEKPRTELQYVIETAGGPTKVGALLGIKPNTMTNMGNNGWLPLSWAANGRLEIIAANTDGRYSAEFLKEKFCQSRRIAPENRLINRNKP